MRIASEPIRGAGDAFAAAIQHLSIDHGRAHIFVPQQFLHGAEVIAVFEQRSGKGMAQGMTTHGFDNASVPRGRADGAVQHRLVQVMTPSVAGAWIDGNLPGGKHLLPAPFLGRIGIFPM